MKVAIVIRSAISRLLFYVDQFLEWNKSSVVVLCYHSFESSGNRYSVSPKIFEKQIKEIAKYSDFISLPELTRYLDGPTPTKSKVLITIDDGYASTRSILPILRKYKVPVVLFLLAHPKNAVRSELDTNEDLLTWPMVKGLISEGFTIGSHSSTHKNFSTIKSTDESFEIAHSKRYIEDKIKAKISSFAFPKGLYKQRHSKLLKKSGYALAFTTESGLVTPKTNPLLIPRTIIDKTHSASDFPAIYSRSWLRFRTLTNKLQLWEKFLS